MAGEGGGVAEDDELHASAGDGDVHAAEVAEEADLSAGVGADEADEDDVAFLSLEAVHGVHGDEVAEGAEEGFPPDEVAEVLHLGAVGGNDAEVDAFVEDAFASDALHVEA